MWLPVNFDTSRNTFDKIMEGKYQNIRFHTMVHNNQPDGGYEGYDLDLAPEPPTWRAYGGNPAGPWFLPQVGTYANETCRSGTGDQCNGAPAADSGCCVAYPNPNNDWVSSLVIPDHTIQCLTCSCRLLPFECPLLPVLQQCKPIFCHLLVFRGAPYR
jgi:hypothetical protein